MLHGTWLKKCGSSRAHRVASDGSGRSRPWNGETRWPPPPGTPRPWTTWWPNTATRACQAHDHFGRLDVVVNNAGYGQFGFIEELSEADARDQIETNVFGALWITQAALPYLRAQRSGHIIQVSSIGGITAFQNVGIYHASKWALEGFSQSLAQEVASFGVHVTLIEPGGFSTDWAGSSARRAEPLPAYADAHAEADRIRNQRMSQPGDPTASAAAILQVVDAAEPPLRVFFGSLPIRLAKADYEQRIKTWEQWQPVSELAQG